MSYLIVAIVALALGGAGYWWYRNNRSKLEAEAKAKVDSALQSAQDKVNKA